MVNARQQPTGVISLTDVVRVATWLALETGDAHAKAVAEAKAAEKRRKDRVAANRANMLRSGQAVVVGKK